MSRLFHARATSSINFENKEVNLWTYEQLSNLSRPNLKNRAMSLRDQIGAERLPALSVAAGVDIVITWLLEVQCALARSSGVTLTPGSFGAPAPADQDGYFNRADDKGFGAMAPAHENRFEAKPYGTDAHAPQQQQRAPMGEANQMDCNAAYEESARAALAARQRNMGSNIF